MAPASPDQVRSHPNVTLRPDKVGCCFKAEHFVFDQAFAVVRHGDRLDHIVEDWKVFPERHKYPNDCPLTAAGVEHARKTADVFAEHAKSCDRRFTSIVCSPYLRCAQTACCIAEKLDLTIRFDLDLGEIFDDMAMRGKNVQGAKFNYTWQQHAEMPVLAQLEERRLASGLSHDEWQRGLVVTQNNGNIVAGPPELLKEQHFPLSIKLPDNKQHRSPKELEAFLCKDFPTVKYGRERGNTQFAITGKLPEYPEPLDGARIRFCYRVNKILKRSVGELASPIIVTHGDAVSAVLSMLREEEQVLKIPFCGWFIGDRQVKVMKKGADMKAGGCFIAQESIFERSSVWKLKLDPRIEFRRRKEQEMDQVRNQRTHSQRQMKRLSHMSKGSNNDLDLTDMSTDRHERSMEVALDHLGVDALDPERNALIKRVASNALLLGAPRISIEPPNMIGIPSQRFSSTSQASNEEPNSPKSAVGARTPRSPVAGTGTASPTDVAVWIDANKAIHSIAQQKAKTSCATWLCRLFV